MSVSFAEGASRLRHRGDEMILITVNIELEKWVLSRLMMSFKTLSLFHLISSSFSLADITTLFLKCWLTQLNFFTFGPCIFGVLQILFLSFWNCWNVLYIPCYRKLGNNQYFIEGGGFNKLEWAIILVMLKNKKKKKSFSKFIIMYRITDAHAYYLF